MTTIVRKSKSFEEIEIEIRTNALYETEKVFGSFQNIADWDLVKKAEYRAFMAELCFSILKEYMKNKLDNFFKLQLEITELLGINDSSDLLDMRNYKFYADINSASWIDDGELYGIEVLQYSQRKVEGYVIILGDNGCGDKFWCIFDDNNKMSDEEFEEVNDY